MRKTIFGSIALASLVVATSGMTFFASVVHSQSPAGGGGQIEIGQDVHHDVSGQLQQIRPLENQGGQHQKPLRLIARTGPSQSDPVLQATAGPSVGTTAGLNFAGVGQGDYGFVPNAAPPDTNAAVGATQVVQWVNTSFAVFDKSTGALLYGPAAGNTLWAGFGGGCQANNDGDPIVQYDKAANRWVFTQFSVTTLPYLQCVAVSTTSDALGSYSRYAFSYGNADFPDYPKLGVWPDAYYISFNIFTNGGPFAGAKACAYDRIAMLVGAPATQVCFQQNTSVDSLLPSDLDGSIPPPAGSPNFFMNFGTNSLNLWKFHVDFVIPTNSTFSGPINLPVAAFSAACGGSSCIRQPGTSQTLDSLADRLMYRLAYRHFADGHEALVVNHSVNPGNGTSGIRWYEVRNPNGILAVYQQGTFAPDASYRWMGSIAMDSVGNIAVGYSVSNGSSLFPSIRYTGRVPGDALGTLQAENTILAGSGSQTSGLNRWGDYSSLSVDPVDDCTLWYTNEYLKASGSFNWSTRLASFQFPSCTLGPTPTPSQTSTGTLNTPTATNTPQPTSTATDTPSKRTATPTATPGGPTSTATNTPQPKQSATPTATPGGPTSTATNTAPPATATSTPQPKRSATPTPTPGGPTSTPTNTPHPKNIY